MSDDITRNAVEAINNYSQSINELRNTDVFRSRRYTGDLGEWYVAQLYEGKVAENQTQKGWDIELKNGEKLQVKTQTYDKGNRWNYFNSDLTLFDRFILVILNKDLKICKLYDVPSNELPLKEGKEKKKRYHWNDLEKGKYSVNPKILPGYNSIKELIETK